MPPFTPPNDTYDRKLAALEKRFETIEHRMPSFTPPNDTYDRKLSALEKRFEILYTEVSYTASLATNIDVRLRAAGECLLKDM